MNYLFADEAGCMTFSKSRGVSRYFILCTVHMTDSSIGAEVLELRRRLAWDGHNLDADQFHATTDSERVREAMFGLIERSRFRIDATILEKSKTQEKLRPTDTRFYQHAWLYHFRYVGQHVAPRNSKLFIHAASIGVRKKRRAFLAAINDVAQQVLQNVECKCSFWSSSSDPCLQVADYCAWAIQKAWESGDTRRRDQIAHNIRSEYDLFSRGNTHYY